MPYCVIIIHRNGTRCVKSIKRRSLADRSFGAGKWRVLGAILASVGIVCLTFLLEAPEPTAKRQLTPVALAAKEPATRARYVADETCAECHRSQYHA
jgi:hypothetical protein